MIRVVVIKITVIETITITIVERITIITTVIEDTMIITNQINNGYSNNNNQQSVQNSGMPQYPQRYMNNQYIPMDIPQVQHVMPNNMYPQYQYISTPAMHPQPAPQIQPNIPNQDQNNQPENMTFQ